MDNNIILLYNKGRRRTVNTIRVLHNDTIIIMSLLCRINNVQQRSMCL